MLWVRNLGAYSLVSFVIFTLIVRAVVSEILYFCDRAYVTMTDVSAVLPLLQKNVDINETVWNSLGDKLYTQVLQWGSDLQWNRVDVLVLADCVYYMEVSVLTIITVEYNIRNYIGH